jgi:hypothetical protein
MSNELPKDPNNAGWVLGWGVIRNSPWDLAGVFPTSDAAQAKAADLSGEYKVSYGSHRLGPDDFMTEPAPLA